MAGELASAASAAVIATLCAPAGRSRGPGEAAGREVVERTGAVDPHVDGQVGDAVQDGQRRGAGGRGAGGDPGGEREGGGGDADRGEAGRTMHGVLLGPCPLLGGEVC
jgi:hypothetical protein